MSKYDHPEDEIRLNATPLIDTQTREIRSHSRRHFLRSLGISAAALPFVGNLPSFAAQENTTSTKSAAPKQRLVIIFSPDGVVPSTFWPDETGANFTFKESLKPLEPFKDKTLILKGLYDKLRGDGDSHMRGIGCLLTGIDLFPGNVQGGSDSPAGWSSGISIDQELKNFLQSNPQSRTRFGSLEFGVMVPERADTWTRMSYAGPNQPVAPIDNSQQMFSKLYGQVKDKESLQSILDDLNLDLKRVSANVSRDDRRILDEHTSLVREMERELKDAKTDVGHAVPVLEPGVKEDNDNIPQISKQQIDLMVSAFAADFMRVATLQYTNSVGEARFRWLGIEKGQHSLSHEPDSDASAQEKLTCINAWYAEQVAYLAKRLSETPEPGGGGSMLDNTLIVWTNELGKGNSHTLDNIPFVLVGGGFGFGMGRALQFDKVAHNRLLMSLAHGMGHTIDKFGNPDLCGDGVLSELRV